MNGGNLKNKVSSKDTESISITSELLVLVPLGMIYLILLISCFKRVITSSKAINC